MTTDKTLGPVVDRGSNGVNKTTRILVVIGTRPEVIKLAPVIRKLYAESWADTKVLLTGQHADLALPLVKSFGISVDEHMQVMAPNQTLASLLSRLIEGIDRALEQYKPSVVIAQGDTASVLASSLASFLRKIPFAHVEAGLRTGNIQLPFPEELNRVLTTRMTKWHFAPTPKAKENLMQEGIQEEDVWVTGNTVIDALKHTLSQDRDIVFQHADQDRDCMGGNVKDPWERVLESRRPLILITAHRRENFGQPLIGICRAILELADRYSNYDFVYAVHPNPQVKGPVHQMLARKENVHLLPPADYKTFCFVLQKAKLILSDSGGVQEEAPALGVPVLVMRDQTERPEAVSIGANRLVGTDPERIIAAVSELLNSPDAYACMSTAGSPYGNGQASDAIVGVLRAQLAKSARDLYLQHQL